MNTADVKEYLARREIPQLFESLLTGLMFHRPDDPIGYLESSLKKIKELGGTDRVRWDTFIGQENKSLPPLNGTQYRRSFFRNVLPDSASFSHGKRYDCLPPIQQFSIESDSGLSETAELIEEYEVFSPSRLRPKVILIIGGPGSGKDTQSLKIAEHYGFEYVSVGALLRRKMIHNAPGNRKWSLITKIITNGELAPQETTIMEIKQKIMEIPYARGLIIDGFPRDVAQALSFEDQICTPDLVAFLACASHRLKERLEKRAVQQGRPDDNPKATERRLTTFKQNVVPLVEYFLEKDLVVTIDADRDEEEVFCDIISTVDSKLFPTKEPTAGCSDLDLSLLADIGGSAYAASESEEQAGCAQDSAQESLKKPKIIFVLGEPCSGKERQCEKLVERHGLLLLSTGELLCGEMRTDTERDHPPRDALDREEQSPHDTLLQLLREAMGSAPDHVKGFLINGFPLNTQQAEEFEAKVGEPSLVLLFERSSGTMAGPLQRRPEDSRDGDYEAITAHYESRELLYKVNTEGPIDEVLQPIHQLFASW